MLPANHGDGLWIEYGNGADRHNVLIDGGPPYADEVIQARLARAGGRLELLVISHVDFDHIGGIVSLLARLPEDTEIGDVWFNGWDHLPGGPDDQLGAVQGEMVSAAIQARKLPWNEHFGGQAVAVPPRDPPPAVTLPGGLRLTLLAPPVSALRALRPKWKKEVEKANLIPGEFESGLAKLLERERLEDILGAKTWDPPALDELGFLEDGSLPNRSSIALLAEYEGHAILLAADSPPATLLPGIQAVCQQRGDRRLRVDAAKLAHHGSKGSTSTELLTHLECSRYLISTNGKIYHHPSLEALARTVLHGGPSPQLLFNYEAPNAKLVNEPAQQARFGYHVVFPDDEHGGLRVEL
jgi:Metallo-beta-lactamase superfamily